MHNTFVIIQLKRQRVMSDITSGLTETISYGEYKQL